MKTLKSTIQILVFLFLLACAETATKPVPEIEDLNTGAFFWPIQVGNEWNYTYSGDWYQKVGELEFLFANKVTRKFKTNIEIHVDGMILQMNDMVVYEYYTGYNLLEMYFTVINGEMAFGFIWGERPLITLILEDNFGAYDEGMVPIMGDFWTYDLVPDFMMSYGRYFDNCYSLTNSAKTKVIIFKHGIGVLQILHEGLIKVELLDFKMKGM